ncbi:ABC transporter permease [Streptomyces sp. NBC_01426]|uniref:ABC transporter permease n=1 Tax=Streptomyces sp. NBC_01426 TaxID=2975866 RepID=UPI002E33FCD1|nr:ABC transporter permease [Streptomyces sp. NBC_01426]
MATTERVGEFAALRLAGATRRQVLRLVAGEALLVVLAGALVGGLVAALNLGGVWGALHLLDVRVPIVVPWETLGAIVAACAALAVVCAVATAAVALRRGPVESAGART